MIAPPFRAGLPCQEKVSPSGTTQTNLSTAEAVGDLDAVLQSGTDGSVFRHDREQRTFHPSASQRMEPINGRGRLNTEC